MRCGCLGGRGERRLRERRVGDWRREGSVREYWRGGCCWFREEVKDEELETFHPAEKRARTLGQIKRGRRRVGIELT